MNTAALIIPWPFITALRLTGSKLIVFNRLLYIQHTIWAGAVYVPVSVSDPNGFQGMCCHIKLFDSFTSGSCCTLQEIKSWRAWSLLGVLVTSAGSNGIFFVGCNTLFIKDCPQPLVISPTKIWTVRDKNLILTFPRFSCSRIIRVYCSLKEIGKDFITIWLYVQDRIMTQAWKITKALGGS